MAHSSPFPLPLPLPLFLLFSSPLLRHRTRKKEEEEFYGEIFTIFISTRIDTGSRKLHQTRKPMSIRFDRDNSMMLFLSYFFFFFFFLDQVLDWDEVIKIQDREVCRGKVDLRVNLWIAFL